MGVLPEAWAVVRAGEVLEAAPPPASAGRSPTASRAPRAPCARCADAAPRTAVPTGAGPTPSRRPPCHAPDRVFLRPGAKSPELLSGIKHLGRSLVLHVPHQESAEFPKEIHTLPPELVLRDVPGKSLQRPRQSLQPRLALLHPPLQPPGHPVVRVRLSPRCLRLLPPLLLALAPRTHPLARSHTRIGAEPLPAEPARAGAQRRGHGRSSTPRARLPLRFSTAGGLQPPDPLWRRSSRANGRAGRPALRAQVVHFWRADLGQFSRASKAVRVGRCDQLPRGLSPPIHAHAGRTKGNGQAPNCKEPGRDCLPNLGPWWVAIGRWARSFAGCTTLGSSVPGNDSRRAGSC